MKRLFFTAIALIALTTGNATVVNSSNSVKARNCASMFNATMIYAQNQGFSEADAKKIALAVWSKCIGLDFTYPF